MLVLAVLIYPILAYTDSLEFFFSANGSCPDIGWACVQNDVLAACGYDTIVDRYYCCGAAAQATCRTSDYSCSGRHGGPSSIQQLCTAGDSTWCCLKDTEQCTPRPGQINVCDATAEDTIGNVSQGLLNDTFSSLSSAYPQATTFSFDATSLSALAASMSTSSSISSSSTLSASTPPTNTSSNTGVFSSLSGGAIAGIVIGSIAGVAAILTAAYIIFRRRSHRKTPINEPNYPLNHLPEMNTRYHHKAQAVTGTVHPGGYIEMGDMHEAQELYAERTYELHS